MRTYIIDGGGCQAIGSQNDHISVAVVEVVAALKIGDMMQILNIMSNV